MELGGMMETLRTCIVTFVVGRGEQHRAAANIEAINQALRKIMNKQPPLFDRAAAVNGAFVSWAVRSPLDASGVLRHILADFQKREFYFSAIGESPNRITVIEVTPGTVRSTDRKLEGRINIL